MNIEVITSFIQNLGFPIAVTCYLLYSQNRQQERHKEEIDNLAEVVEKNTEAITRLTEVVLNGSNKQ